MALKNEYVTPDTEAEIRKEVEKELKKKERSKTKSIYTLDEEGNFE